MIKEIYDDEPTLTDEQVRYLNRMTAQIINSTGWGEINIKFAHGQMCDVRYSVSERLVNNFYNDGALSRNLK